MGGRARAPLVSAGSGGSSGRRRTRIRLAGRSSRLTVPSGRMRVDEGDVMPAALETAATKLGFLTIGLFDGADPGPGHESTLRDHRAR